MGGQPPRGWILFSRLQSSKTAKFVKCLVVFTSLLCAKHGAGVVSESMSKVQPGVMEMLLTGVFADAIGSISGKNEEKVVAVAIARFLAECPTVLANEDGFAKLLSATVVMLEKPEELKANDEELDEEAEAMEQKAGYSAAYSQLRNAARKESDPCADVPDAKANLARRLAATAATAPGKIASVVAAKCPPEVQQAIAGTAPPRASPSTEKSVRVRARGRGRREDEHSTARKSQGRKGAFFQSRVGSVVQRASRATPRRVSQSSLDRSPAFASSPASALTFRFSRRRRTGQPWRR